EDTDQMGRAKAPLGDGPVQYPSGNGIPFPIGLEHLRRSQGRGGKVSEFTGKFRPFGQKSGSLGSDTDTAGTGFQVPPRGLGPHPRPPVAPADPESNRLD